MSKDGHRGQADTVERLRNAPCYQHREDQFGRGVADLIDNAKLLAEAADEIERHRNNIARKILFEARDVLDARNEALEEAAQVADREWYDDPGYGQDIADAIRALIEEQK